MYYRSFYVAMYDLCTFFLKKENTYFFLPAITHRGNVFTINKFIKTLFLNGKRFQKKVVQRKSTPFKCFE